MIRTARPTETEAARAVLAAAYDQYATAFPPENWLPYRADILDLEGRANDSELLVAEIDGAVLGCVSYYPPGGSVSYPADERAEPWPPDWSAIRLLAVDPAARGRGVGRALTDACIARSRAEGAAGVGLHTTAAMEVARAMYEGMGFERAPAHDFRAGEVLVEAYRLIP